MKTPFEDALRKVIGQELARALEPLISELKRLQQPKPDRGQTRALPTPVAARDWSAATLAAAALLRAKPERLWTLPQLCREVCAADARAQPLRGLHLGLLPRLRAEGLIEQTRTGELRLSSSSPGPTRAVAAPPKPVARRAPAVRDWERLTAVARELLAENPARAWTTTELTQATAGVVGESSLRGLHLGLLPRLLSSGEVRQTEAGLQFGAAPPPQPVVARPPLVRKPNPQA